VECLTKDDCDSAHKTCKLATNSCAPCVANADCTSGLCDTATGACADKSTLLYVNNSLTGGCSDSGMGAFTRPFCSVQVGFTNAAASGKTLIVLGGTYAESVIAQPATTAYAVHAIGVGVTPPTIMAPMLPSAPALKLQTNNGQQLTITLDNFVIRGGAGANGHGILCSGQGGSSALTKLILLRSTVQNNAQLGVSASSCDVTLDQDTVAANTQGGVALSSSDFTISNSLIRDNGLLDPSGSAVGGISTTGTSARAVIVNNTVVNNKNSGTGITPVGVACGAATVTFNTVIKGNSGFATETGGCSPTYSAYNGATGTGNRDISLCTLANLFSDPMAGDYHPNKTAAGACTIVLVNVGTPMSGTVNAPDHDLGGTRRPQPTGGAWDIGCYESP
jgi:hypothetical protein